eukprot:3694668-Alexandrium_andersonii.AAC.1
MLGWALIMVERFLCGSWLHCDFDHVFDGVLIVWAGVDIRERCCQSDWDIRIPSLVVDILPLRAADQATLSTA